MMTPFASSQLFRMPSGSERINYVVPPAEHVWTRMGVEDRLEKIKQFRGLYFASGIVKQNSHDALYSNEHITAMGNQRFTVAPHKAESATMPVERQCIIIITLAIFLTVC